MRDDQPSDLTNVEIICASDHALSRGWNHQVYVGLETSTKKGR